ncbi:hypothetical protein D3C79_963120 [compost metagenome]
MVSGANGAQPDVEQQRVVGGVGLTNDHGSNLLHLMTDSGTPLSGDRISVGIMNARFAI